MREVVDLYFHREELEVKEDQGSDNCMSTDTEATDTVRRLQLHCPGATASLQMAMHEALAPATAVCPQEQEYYYDSNDSILDLDEEYIWTWQHESCSGGLPIRAPFALHRDGHPTSVGLSNPTSTNCLICGSC